MEMLVHDSYDLFSPRGEGLHLSWMRLSGKGLLASGPIWRMMKTYRSSRVNIRISSSGSTRTS
jgi:hypothetical protein